MTALLSPHHTLLCTNNGANMLTSTVLGGGIAHGVTRIIIDRYKAFQRCFRASLEGFAMSIGSMTMVVKAIQRIGSMTMVVKAIQRIGSMTMVVKAIQRIGSMTNVIKVNIYGNQEVKRLTMR